MIGGTPRTSRGLLGRKTTNPTIFPWQETSESHPYQPSGSLSHVNTYNGQRGGGIYGAAQRKQRRAGGRQAVHGNATTNCHEVFQLTVKAEDPSGVPAGAIGRPTLHAPEEVPSSDSVG